MVLITYSLLLTFLLSSSVFATNHQDEDFVFPDDDLAERIAAVNEGSLRFIETDFDSNLLRSENIITIKPGSLSDGWVRLEQCYQNLDPIGKVEIVYQYKSLKNLSIVSFSKILSARVVNQSVQLEDVEPGARLCVSAEIRNFYKQPDNTYSLVNGPYHRKFFDGYFPLNVYLEIIYPEDLLKVKSIEPDRQAGFSVDQEENRITINAIFEGKLTTEINFSTTGK